MTDEYGVVLGKNNSDHYLGRAPSYAVSKAWYHRGRSLEKVSDRLAAFESYDMAVLHLPEYGEACGREHLHC